MINLLEKQQSFVQDDIPTRLLKLAQHLAQIRDEVSAANFSEAIALIRESQFFLEWTVPTIAQTNIDRAEELVELVRTLANWKYNWVKICSDAAAIPAKLVAKGIAQVSVEAGAMSERVLEISAVI
jgi:uncharacterized protein CbrC (UPF0167 family)